MKLFFCQNDCPIKHHCDLQPLNQSNKWKCFLLKLIGFPLQSDGRKCSPAQFMALPFTALSLTKLGSSQLWPLDPTARQARIRSSPFDSSSDKKKAAQAGGEQWEAEQRCHRRGGQRLWELCRLHWLTWVWVRALLSVSQWNHHNWWSWSYWYQEWIWKSHSGRQQVSWLKLKT